MALRYIRTNEDDLLRKKSKPVTEINNKILTLLDDMNDTIVSANGLGLAAPQVGVLRRVAIIKTEDAHYELINPEIVETKDSQVKSEACLSVPRKQGKVERPGYVRVRATNRDGEEYEVEGTELLAVAFCHEIDHLDGILFIDRATEITDREDGEDAEEV